MYSHSLCQRKWKVPDATEVHSATPGKGISGVKSATTEASEWILSVSLKGSRQHSENAKHEPTEGDFRWKNTSQPLCQAIQPRDIAESRHGLVRVSPASGQVHTSTGFRGDTENYTFPVSVLIYRLYICIKANNSAMWQLAALPPTNYHL